MTLHFWDVNVILKGDEKMANGGYKESFARVEIKYSVPANKYKALLERLSEYVEPDEYGDTRIYNIYYDTPDFRLIRKSLEKPKYKEKLRLRTYKVPNESTSAFIEIKKKYNGIVYKRRISLPYGVAKWHLDHGIPFTEMNTRSIIGKSSFSDVQIENEINSMLDLYGNLGPGMMVSYDRLAFRGKENPDFRVTFDKNIRWRNTELDLTKGGYGNPLLRNDERIMEIKISDAMPIEIARILSELQIYKTSYSKYGNGYIQLLENERHKKGIKKYA